MNQILLFEMVAQIQLDILVLQELTPWNPWCMYTSVNWVNIGSGNGLVPARRLAIAWTNADLLPTQCLGISCFPWNFKTNTIILFQENAIANVVCKMSSILFCPQCVNPINHGAALNYQWFISESEVRSDDDYGMGFYCYMTTSLHGKAFRITGLL